MCTGGEGNIADAFVFILFVDASDKERHVPVQCAEVCWSLL